MLGSFLNSYLCLIKLSCLCSTAIAALKEREPGAFLIRDSNSFQGAYGLALKVASPPPNVNNHSSKGTPHLQAFPHTNIYLASVLLPKLSVCTGNTRLHLEYSSRSKHHKNLEQKLKCVISGPNRIKKLMMIVFDWTKKLVHRVVLYSDLNWELKWQTQSRSVIKLKCKYN